MENKSLISLYNKICDESVEVIPDFLLERPCSLDYEFTESDVQLLIEEFGYFSDDAQYITRNLVPIATMTMEWTCPVDELELEGASLVDLECEYEVISEIHNGLVTFTWYPEDMYWYLNCTTQEALKFLGVFE